MSQGKPATDITTRRTVDPALGPELTRTEARSAMAHYALLAELHAYRYTQATSGRRYTAAARSQRGYRRAARMCRVLGEFVRRDPSSLNGGEGNRIDLASTELVRATRELAEAQWA